MYTFTYIFVLLAASILFSGLATRSVEAVTIINSIHAESSSGGQIIKNGTPGHDGIDGRAGQDGLTETATTTSVSTDSTSTAVSVYVQVNDQLITTVSTDTTRLRSTSSSFEPRPLHGSAEDGVTSDYSDYTTIQELLTSIHNLFVMYVSSILYRPE